MVQFATLPSKIFSLWHRLGVRFKLEDSPPSGLGARLGTTIIPVTQADALLSTLDIAKKDLDLSAAGGSFVTAFTVPAGKRWTIYHLHLLSTAGQSQLLLSDNSQSVRLGLSKTGPHDWSGSMPADESWIITAATTGSGSDNNRECSILYDEEDAY
jgi:hypothetical protein